MFEMTARHRHPGRATAALLSLALVLTLAACGTPGEDLSVAGPANAPLVAGPAHARSAAGPAATAGITGAVAPHPPDTTLVWGQGSAVDLVLKGTLESSEGALLELRTDAGARVHLDLSEASVDLTGLPSGRRLEVRFVQEPGMGRMTGGVVLRDEAGPLFVFEARHDGRGLERTVSGWRVDQRPDLAEPGEERACETTFRPRVVLETGSGRLELRSGGRSTLEAGRSRWLVQVVESARMTRKTCPAISDMPERSLVWWAWRGDAGGMTR